VRKPEKVISLGKFDVQVELFVRTQTMAEKVGTQPMAEKLFLEYIILTKDKYEKDDNCYHNYD
jgi:hypothetical protein